MDADSLCISLYRGFYRQFALSGAGVGACATSAPSTEPLDLAALDGAELTAELAATCVPGNEIFDGLDLAIGGGRVRFNLSAMEACNGAGRAIVDGAPINDANADSRLADIFATFNSSSCPDATTGLVAAGGACEQPWDCADRSLVCEPDAPSGAVRACRTRAGEGQACLGPVGFSLPIRSCDPTLSCRADLCAPKLPEGEPCTSDSDCQDGLGCGAGDVCRPPSASGEPCEPFLHSQCAAGLFCKADATCAPPIAFGEPCASAERCDGCARCLSLGDEQRCRDVPVDGERCDGTFDCASGLWCDDSAADGLDVCAPEVDDGGDCSASIFACAAEFDCTNDVCRPRAELGGDCTVDRCADGLFCVEDACRAGVDGDPCVTSSECDATRAFACLVTSTCGEPGGAGAPCTAGDQCRTGLLCDAEQGACAAAPEPGAPCSTSGACAPGAFCDTTSATCVGKRGAGGACDADDQCLSAFCVDGATCGVTPVTCWAGPGLFETMLFFAVVWPLRIRRLRAFLARTPRRAG